jgi:hypothetical protein
VVADFVARIAGDIAVSPELASDLVWRLAVERFDHADTDAVPTHSWVARWLGVPVEAVLDASAAALTQLEGLADGARRDRIRADPNRYLLLLTVHVESAHADAVEARVRTLLRNFGPWIPPHLVDEVPLVSE